MTLLLKMPPPCGVESHVRCYKESATRTPEDATPLRGGVSRWLLPVSEALDLQSHSLLTAAMFTQAYQPHELRFAYCYRVYFRWHTLCNHSCPPLAKLTAEELSDLVRTYGIEVLECAVSDVEILTLVSLQPQETIASCASKLKGRVSKWLTEKVRSTQPLQLLGRGYFACTVGKSTREEVEQYLDDQGEHHQYSKRELPPVFVERYDLSAEDEARLKAKHSCVVVQFHIVLATYRRRRVFGSKEGQAIAAEWRRRQEEMRIAIIKVSFVPDHRASSRTIAPCSCASRCRRCFNECGARYL